MRLWHTLMIGVLPREQLVAQWREISSICGSIQKNGTLNHLLVNFVLNYDYDHLISYAYYVRAEMTKRDYRTMDKVWDKIISLKPNYTILPLHEVYKEKMDNEYWTICYYNLKEKWMCCGFSTEQWQKIDDLNNKLRSAYYNDLG